MKYLFQLGSVLIFIHCTGSKTAGKTAQKSDSFIVFNKTQAIEGKEQVNIGKQVWMTTNLSVRKFKNGEEIPFVTNENDWYMAGITQKPACCYVNNDSSTAQMYGLLYNWFAVTDSRELAPDGWRIASMEDWMTMSKYLGGDAVAGKKLKSKFSWDRQEVQNTNNETGFSALLCGHRGPNSKFYNDERTAVFWTTTGNSNDDAWTRTIVKETGDLGGIPNQKGYGYSVRCIKN